MAGFKTPRQFTRNDTTDIQASNIEQNLYQISLATDIIDARAFGGLDDVTVGPTKEQMISAAIQYAAATGKSTVLIPASMLPYNAAQVTFNSAVRIILEGDGNSAPTDVNAFGVVGNGVADDTIPLNAALASGLSIDLRGRTYKANNLIGSTTSQRIYSSTGIARIVKNANGPLFTHSGDAVELENIRFEGDNPAPVFTGDNIVLTGQGPRLRNCGSRYASGRALKATGDHVLIDCTCDVYQTADASGTGYDIEIGVSGTATLYHRLIGVYTSQNTGGILLIDTGEHEIHGGQFGKLYIQKGTGPAGTGAGKTIGCRILGPILVELSGGSFIANHRGANATVTFALGTSGMEFLEHTTNAGAAITNNGNANNVIIRQISGGSTIKFFYGDDAALTTMELTPNSGMFLFSQAAVQNNKVMQWMSSTGTQGAHAFMSNTDVFSMLNDISGKPFDIYATGSAGLVRHLVNGAVKYTTNQFGPQLPVYTVATRPAALDGTIIYVSDGGAGAVFQGRAGGAWVNLG